MNKKYKALFLKVKDIINKSDPIGLLGQGAPDDEYEKEIQEIIFELNRKFEEFQISEKHRDKNKASRKVFENQSHSLHAVENKNTGAEISPARMIIGLSGGLIKTEKQANYAVLFITAAIMLFVWWTFNVKSGSPKVGIKAPPGQVVIYPKNGPPKLELKTPK